MVRLGKLKEANIDWEDTAIGKRGIIGTPSTRTQYIKEHIGRSEISTGASVVLLKATHGLDTIVGGIAQYRATTNAASVVKATPVYGSVHHASCIKFAIEGKGAMATHGYFSYIVFGTASS